MSPSMDPIAIIGAMASVAGTVGLFAWLRRAAPSPRAAAFGVVTLLAADLGLAAVLGGPGGAIAGLVSPLFLLAAAAQIAVAAALLPDPVHPWLRVLVAGGAVPLALAPTVAPTGPGAVAATAIGAATFVALFVVSLQFLYRHKQLSARVARFLVLWSGLACALAAGWFFARFDGSVVVLAGAAALQLVGLMGVSALAPPVDREPRIPWVVRPFWTFEILVLTFVAEFFVGALLDLSVAGTTFLGFIPFVPIPAGGVAALGPAIYDGLWFAAAILASAWFLVVFGVTMGALVVFKIRETHERPQRYRLALMIGVYALGALYIPSLASSTPLLGAQTMANLPIVGWGFGLRAGGPFESGVFAAVLIMYATVGVLTVLFGRKALCSVMCGAALMYQGTTIHEMREFNQTSRVGEYFLGSQISTAYTALSGIALVSLFGISLLSFLHRLPTVQVANGQFDTATLPLPIELYFGALWFGMFVTIPYLGTYNCATTGLCHWGALSLPFARVGFFRLKVKDRSVCQQCTTFDCAKSCPVGLVDMPQYFRTTGEYRSSKCCGVGSCVGACPYGNLYHQDVRLWLRRKLGRAERAPHGTPLPMVRPNVAPPAPAVPASASSLAAAPLGRTVSDSVRAAR